MPNVLGNDVLCGALPRHNAMKILHILSQIPSFTGSGIYLQATMRHAHQQGYANFLLAGVPADFEFSAHCGALACSAAELIRFGHDIDMQIVGMSDVMPYPSARFCDLDADALLEYEACFDRHLQQAVARWQPDLIHSHHLWLLTSVARQRFPAIPMVASCHGSDLRQFHCCNHLRQQVMLGCSKVSAVCALSLEQKQQIINSYEIPAEKIHIVGAGYDSRIFNPPEPGSKDRATIHMVYAGKLSNAKGVPWLLRALDAMPEQDWHFHLVGDSSGEEKQEILALAHQLGSRITRHGRIEPAQLARLLKSSHLFVLPSFYEGIPLVVLEALACGCRIVTTDLPGIREVFSGHDCAWVQRIDLPEMKGIDHPHPDAEAGFIQQLQDTLSAQMSAIRAQPSAHPPERVLRLLRQYEWSSTFSRIEQVYQDLLS